ncbi:hypothetical protein [Agrobacterium salinitolerans]|uniref:Uncharacterized protein n=1 Tax=Agrobacterium salinitolerans TaxID=1183413 RepID=A0A9X3R0Y4_9HYPH|nr:hypothetical protein [Agrobacterium salinitolerans]MCZ7939817.1 hypothetical protein [Agrobacterium salinitolerans]
MLKRFREKWRSWEDAVLGIDDPQGDYLIALEKRLARLETEVAGLKAQPREEVAHGAGVEFSVEIDIMK